jgi:hypothetical protein
MGEVTAIFPDENNDSQLNQSPNPKSKKRKTLSPANEEKQTKIRQNCKI